MKYGKWCLLFLKRLYRKPIFLALLLLIPLLTFGYSSLSREDSGILTVAVAQRDSEDAFAAQMIADLCESSQLIRFTLCETAGEAEELVTYGKADSAWIFDEDLKNKVAAFVAKPERRNAFIDVIEREESMFLTMTREKLGGFVFSYLSPEFYLQYVRNNLPQLNGMTDSELMAHYDAVSLSDDLFTFAARESAPKEQSYLLTPVRGLLAIVTLLCGMAAAMFYVEDTQQGLFSRIPMKNLPAMELLCQLIAVGNVALVATLAMLISGLGAELLPEIGLLVLYVPCVSLFSMLLRRILRGTVALGVAAPLLAIVALCVCPVFLDLAQLRTFSMLLPVNYAIRGAYNPIYLLYMGIHTAVCAAGCFLLDKTVKTV
ncbi:MAG: hypothetical protein E7453_08555 [Ruminococcaceae bacterium]|nr:hypothetical protein [Oscillospiraceae bacterium]